jgi:hypothetical protein
VRQLEFYKAELLALLTKAREPRPNWDPSEADGLVAELHAEVGHLRRHHFGSTFPEPLATVVVTYLDVAASYIAHHEAEVARGWDPLELLRGVQPRLREIVARAKAETKTTG